MRAISARWAVSFADLCLLLLGFLIIAHARPEPARLTVPTPLPEARDHAPDRADLVASRLFEPGEALLTSAGRTQVAAFAARAGQKKIHLVSIGADLGTSRLDAWELAAARAAAVARALVASGVPEERIQLAIDRAEARPQRLALTLG